MEWTYSKDVYVGEGQDCAWVDNIQFPPTAIIVDVETVEERNVNIYPNPARDFVRVSTVNGQQSTVKIYNTIGMLVDEFEINSDEIEINVSDYKSGVYFVKVSTINGSVIKKFIIE